jgi:hypothetical protein
MKRELASLIDALAELRDANESIARRIEDLAPAVERFVDSNPDDNERLPPGLNSLTMLQMMCDGRDAESCHLEDKTIALLGDGFMPEEELQEFLADKDFTIADLDEEYDILVLGHSGFDESELHRELDWLASSDNGLILSQELLIIYLLSGDNPLEVWSTETLLIHAEDHPGLEAVINWDGEFGWPVKHVGTNGVLHEFVGQDFSAESPLHRLGYNTSEGKLTTAERRELLAQMFNESNEHLFETTRERVVWGKRMTQQRLYAMSKHLTWLCSLRKNTAPRAVEKWAQDLKWLKQNFYKSAMQFKWPTESQRVDSKVRETEPKSVPLSASWPFPTGMQEKRQTHSNTSSVATISSLGHAIPSAVERAKILANLSKPASGHQSTPTMTHRPPPKLPGFQNYVVAEYADHHSTYPNTKWYLRGERLGDKLSEQFIATTGLRTAFPIPGYEINGKLRRGNEAVRFIPNTEVEEVRPVNDQTSVLSCPHCNHGVAVPRFATLRVLCKCRKYFYCST